MTQTHHFQAEVSRLLSIVANALYSEREVFLRELISNASDACDRLRYESQLHSGLMADGTELKITLEANKEANTLVIGDNGIGMTTEELIANLGTIARSGTAEFLERVADKRRGKASSSEAVGHNDFSSSEAIGTAAPEQIGQFGVGFYSAFMVADKVEVLSKKAGTDKAHLWTSEGKGEFSVTPSDAPFAHGTRITLYLKADAHEYLDEARLKEIVTRYSDHIAFPIVIPGPDNMQKTLNSASALWLKSPKDITPEQYKEFYHHAGHAFDDPWATLHWHAEGTIDYRALLFVPSSKPFDLFDPQRRNHLKLYVKRVFITEKVEGLLPAYLRFMRGVVDSEDLPLNISREMLQHNPVIEKIRSGLIKRILGDLAKEAKSNSDYITFWNNFGAALKEGLYEDKPHHDLILRLCRFHTTRTLAENDANLISLDALLDRLPEGQDALYYITGSDAATLSRSPQLEALKAKGFEVLLMTDAVDDFWVNMVEQYKGKPFRSVTKSEAVGEKEKAAETPEALAPLVAAFKSALGDEVSDVRVSQRLTTSAVCLVAGENEIDINLARLLRAHKQLPEGMKRVLEINPTHPVITKLAGNSNSDEVKTAALLLLDQARIMEGEPLPDPAAFAERLTALVGKGLAA